MNATADRPKRAQGTGTTAFVLPGGGSLGAVQVGMLHALHDAGIQPDLVVGTSIGGFNGSFVAADPATAHLRLARVWATLRRRDVLQIRATSLILGALGRRDSLCSNERLQQFLASTLQFDRIEDSKVPFVVTATDVDTGEPIALTCGPALSALLATSALPGFLPPIYRDGRTLIDGGISSAWPVEIALSAGATRVYVLETATCNTMVRRRGAFAMFERSVDLMSDRVVALQRQAIAANETVEVFEIPAPPSHVSLLDLSSTGELIKSSLRSTKAWLANHAPRNAAHTRPSGEALGDFNRQPRTALALALHNDTFEKAHNTIDAERTSHP